MARKLKDNAVIDEFTSVVNRETAKSCSVALSKHIKKRGLKNIVLATCHDDILEWLDPDWVYNTDTKEISRGHFGNLTSTWRYYLAPTRLGHCSAAITISQKTSIKVRDVGYVHGMELQSDLFQHSPNPVEQ